MDICIYVIMYIYIYIPILYHIQLYTDAYIICIHRYTCMDATGKELYAGNLPAVGRTNSVERPSTPKWLFRPKPAFDCMGPKDHMSYNQHHG